MVGLELDDGLMIDGGLLDAALPLLFRELLACAEVNDEDLPLPLRFEEEVAC
jgi:hypothetical protein